MPERWSEPPARPTLSREVVHVWRAPLRHGPDRLSRFLETLSDEEVARAERFRFPVHRDRFIAGRGIQRDILARYLRTPPAALRYRTSPHGKPSLDLPAEAPDLRFNVSNAGDLALYALTLHRDIGVDLEEVRAMDDAAAIAERFFSAAENATFARMGEDERTDAFFRCWTRKEAFVKAVGEGLSMPLDCFDVSFARDEPAAVLATRGDPAHHGRWFLRALEPAEGFAGALVTEGAHPEVACFDWRPAGA